MAGRLINRLTVVSAKTLPPGRHADGDGLYLYVGHSGGRSWVFRWKRNGRRREMGLGGFPTVSLTRARKLAAEAREIVASGGDPLAARRRRAAPTFEEAAAAFITAMEPGWSNEKHRQQWRNSLAAYARPIARKVVSDIGTDDVLACLNPIWTKKPETAARVRSRIERILDFARVRGWREGENPARWRGHLAFVLPARGRLGRGHFGAMPWQEVPAFLSRMRQRESVSRLALEFLILTAARTGEALGARWEEVDMQAAVWTVPASRMKAGREHRVPLSPRAVAILERVQALAGREPAPKAFVFPGTKRGGALSNMAMENVLRRMGLKEEGVTIHGFRSAFRDWVAETTSFPPEVAEMALAHAIGSKVEAAYRRGDLFAKRRQLMDAWERFLAEGPHSHCDENVAEMALTVTGGPASVRPANRPGPGSNGSLRAAG